VSGGRSAELERAVSETLIDAETLNARIAELGQEVSEYYEGRDLLLIGVLKGAGLLHGRPDAAPDRPVRGRLHGDLELRRRDRLVRGSSGSSRTSTSTSRTATCSWSRTSSTRVSRSRI
jgi:hypothetical protein